RLLGPEGEFHDEEGNQLPLSWWSPSSWATFRRVTHCLGVDDCETLWRAALAARLLWQSLHSSLIRGATPNDAVKAGLPSTPDQRQLFFIAYCFFHCSTPSVQNEYVLNRGR
ncbi:unnamed protein product, partial [Ixodes hexagonus]